jgi:hypothetical protein
MTRVATIARRILLEGVTPIAHAPVEPGILVRPMAIEGIVTICQRVPRVLRVAESGMRRVVTAMRRVRRGGHHCECQR